MSQNPVWLYPASKKWKKRSKMVKMTDSILEDTLPTDIIILIREEHGREAVAVGNHLESCTVDVRPVVIEPKDWTNPMRERTPRRLILVDAPAFDNTHVDASEILRRISVWLAASYDDSMKIAGIIFLHEISQVRMRGVARRNTDVFKKLCGEDTMKYVALCTTMWEGIAPEVAHTRENQLREMYWKDMITEGAQVMRIRRESTSAWRAVNAMLTKRKGGLDDFTIMSIQKELVDLQELLPETEAGRFLRASLEKELEQQKQRMKQLVESAGGNGNREQQRQRQEIQKTLGQISTLSISVPRRMLNYVPWPTKDPVRFGKQKKIQAEIQQVNSYTLGQINEEEEEAEEEAEDQVEDHLFEPLVTAISPERVSPSRKSTLELAQSSIISGTPSPVSSFRNYNLAAERRAQSSIISYSTSGSSATTEYGSLFFSRDLSSQSSIRSVPWRSKALASLDIL
ncbi:hypothetical protein D9619_000444 [Psilocybe cf. subviscida]|uniref:Uncharacterized protein n=1 Tax=Psilocybe cf. subviscida TaxID=2480587 RepID=A0A8H5BEP9_9AGAR|nr:hypothetical protein D9619_000444 [Psilocybe cf. subviscida]